MKLPPPEIDAGMTLTQAINRRYSCRKFLDKKLNLQQISNLLWAGGGRSKYRRTVPSAGATYPLELYLITGENCVEEIDPGVYLYLWQKHSLKLNIRADLRKELAIASLGQNFISRAPVSILIAGDYRRTTSYYGRRGERYVHMETGHVCQNIHLIATSLRLGTVVIGAFQDEEVRRLLKINQQPLAIMPVGYPALTNGE